jgi:hypothetical protein
VDDQKTVIEQKQQVEVEESKEVEFNSVPRYKSRKQERKFLKKKRQRRR